MSFYDVREQQNYLTCKDHRCEFFCTLVNSYLCGKCPYKQEVPSTLMPERKIEKRETSASLHIFTTACSQCDRYNKEAQNCYLIHNSKTIQEMLEDSHRHCPRHLW
jgi:hypothetical protein